MASLNGQSIGRYHILESLGEGGMATVYKAYDTRLERNVAVKVIRTDQFAPALLAQVLKRFEREAKALARLTHPNIVHVNDYGEHEGVPYLVMDYLPGGTLKQAIKGEPMPWRESIKLLLPIAEALSYAHEHEILHRDVKPSNILLTDKGRPMLTDFGIAKILDLEEGQTLTATGVGIGTPEYMSPEQGLGRGVDARTDIYSLGIVLYELVTGRKPYTADTPMAVVDKHLHDPLPRPSQVAPGLPEAIENLLLKMLAKNPDDRYSDMAAVVTAMEGLLSGTAIVGGLATQLEVEQPVPPAAAPRTQIAVEDKTKSKSWLVWVAMILGLLFLGLFTAGGIFTVGGMGFFTRPTSTVEVVVEPTDKPTSVPISSRDIGETPVDRRISPKDGVELVLIPAGEFIMGSNSDDPYFWGAESPMHKVYLDDYWVYRTEVTNRMYRACVQAKACSQPVETFSRTHEDYFFDHTYDDYPVIYVKYADAQTYCTWADARLPTEAEWEKAARGTDGRLFPWGNAELQRDHANFCDIGCPNPDSQLVESEFDDGFRDVAPVGSFPAGNSPYGIFDMAGNVLEWVADWYAVDYYATAPYENPTGPESGTKHPIRGGSWWSDRTGLRPAARASKSLEYSSDMVGFRCVVDAP
jgi:formylglycine-generating enzyme required for sulfatase activity/tRNA A-37 threonylcarbamoyl transferase component Bud32